MNPRTKPTQEQVDALIASVSYTRLPSGKAIVCEIMTTMGWPVHGISAVVDLENYDEERGLKAAYGYAVKHVWDIAAFQIQCKISSGEIESRHAAIAAEYKEHSNGQSVTIN